VGATVKGVSTVALRRPMVIAHRGASALVPEHTLTAYQRAIEVGADGVECDVRLTRDGVLVCVHDRKVNRTSNGRGVVSTLELARLAELDFGSWHPSSADVDEPDVDRSKVLTLERLLEVVTAADRPVDIAIETKHPNRYAGLVELEVARLLERFGLDRRREGRGEARVMSFSAVGLRRISALAPEVRTVYLMEFAALRRLSAVVVHGDIPILGPSISLVRRSPGLVARLHDKGFEVHVWTVDKPGDIDRCLRLGVDGIITNRPEFTLRQVGERF
jgi:glycerophosphoryl diester phosphodiesterase